MGDDGGGLFGRIAIGKGFITEAQLSRALRFQEEIQALGLRKPLGEVLVHDGALLPDEVELVLRLQRINEKAFVAKRFGRVAVKNHLIDGEQLEAALAVAREEAFTRPLGEVLMKQGALTASQARAIQRALDASSGDGDGGDGRSTTARLAEAIEVEPEEDAGEAAGLEARVQDVIFAAVALRDGLVLVPELERALREQLAFGGDPPPLPGVLRERGILSPADVAAVAEAAARSRAERLTIPGYEVLDVLGGGTTSIVLRARHEMIDREVAIKLFRAEHMAATQADALMEEARTVARIRHPNVVGLYEVGRVHRRIYYVMELIDGPTLHDEVQARGRVPEREALTIARDVTRALGAIHEAGLVHRDVKPRNIVLTPGGQAKLTDLGLAREADRPDEHPDAIYGTPHTMAPEQANGDAVDIRTDLYGLGATLYQALTGSPPFDGPDAVSIMVAHMTEPVMDPRARCGELSAGAAELVLRLLAKRPDERPPAPADVEQALEGLLAFSSSGP